LEKKHKSLSVKELETVPEGIVGSMTERLQSQIWSLLVEMTEFHYNNSQTSNNLGVNKHCDKMPGMING
jgi:hypothetical protein